jgi:hypothetical protein
MTSRTTLPNWVIKRDGRLVPFDGDRVCRAVFAAGERAGRADPLLARELTDGVLHFLAADGAADPLPSDQLAEVVTKVVRELGHPALAQSFTHYRNARIRRPAPNGSATSALYLTLPDDTWAGLIATRPGARELTRRAAGAALATYSRRSVYPPDLVAAEGDGLLTFFDLETPFELAGGVVAPKPPAGRLAGPGMIEALESAREQIGSVVAIDGPEYVLAPIGSSGAAGAWVRELRIGLRVTGLRAAVNLNAAEPPAWDESGVNGPLFPHASSDETERLADLTDALLDHLVDGDTDSVRIDWHLGERDFAPARRNRLLRLARRALDGAPLAFVPDRPRRPVALAEGLDRARAAVLGVVGVNLSRLLEIIRPENELRIDPPTFLRKLASLARLALSAGHARREFLRRHGRPAVTRVFLPERARLVVVPVGLESAVRAVTGHSPSAGGPGLEFARHTLHTLHAVVRNDAMRHLPACVDTAPPGMSSEADRMGTHPPADATPRQQLRAAGVLHAAIEAGTAVVRLPEERPPAPEEIAHVLWYAWQQPGLVRVRFARAFLPHRQLSAGW